MSVKVMKEIAERKTKVWKLTDEFLERFKHQQPPWGSLGWTVFKRTYARWIPSENRTEVWWELCRRVIEGNFNLIPNDPTVTQWEMEQAFEHMFYFRWLPAGRGLWMSGSSASAKVGASLVNCWAISIEPGRYYSDAPLKPSFPWTFLMDMSMLGGGVGYSITHDCIDKFDPVNGEVNLTIVCDPKHHDIGVIDADYLPPRNVDHTYIRVKDSRRGWTDALRVVVDSHWKKTKYNYNLVIDVSDVRASGTRIRGFGGTSAGPGPLVSLLRAVNGILNNASGRKLTSVEAFDICCYIAKCVVSGNVRRSATLALGDAIDGAFFTSKQDKDMLMEVRWAANISVSVDDAFDNYEALVDSISDVGEPGILSLERFRNYGRFADGLKEGCDVGITTSNPCFTGDMMLLTDQGYRSFADLHASGESVVVQTDNRVWHDGVKHFIQDKGKNTSVPDFHTTKRSATRVQLTRENTETVSVHLDGSPVVRCTPDHRFMTRSGVVEARDLAYGEKVLVALPQAGDGIAGKDPSTFDEKLALLAGLLVGDGCICKTGKTMMAYLDFWGDDAPRMAEYCKGLIDSLYEEDYEIGMTRSVGGPWQTRTLAKARIDIGTKTVGGVKKLRLTSSWLANVLDRKIGLTKETKKVFPATYFSNSKASKFFLAGLFYADGTVLVGKARKTISVRLAQSNKPFIEDATLALHANGIRARWSSRRKAGSTLLPDGRGGMKEYETKEMFETIISGSSRFRYAETIGFVGHPEKELKLDSANREFPSKREHAWVKVKSVVPSENADVYCLSEPVTQSIIVNTVSVSNCSEIGLEQGEPCNLVELFPYIIERDGQDLEEIAKIAFRYAKRVTFAKYDWEITKEVVERNRRVGVSISGWEDYKLWLTSKGKTEEDRHRIIDSLYKAICEEDTRVSELLGCNESIKKTTIKPSGSISNLPGVSPGRHAHVSPYYIRRIRISQSDPLFEVLQDARFPIEADAYSPNTMVVEFPVQAPTAELEGFKCAADFTLEEQMQDQMELQTWWADNSVSSTLYFKPHEVELIPDLLRKYKFKSTSLLPYSDHGYVQAPYEPISKEEYERRMQDIIFWPTEEHMSKEKRDMELLAIDECAGGACPIR